MSQRAASGSEAAFSAESSNLRTGWRAAWLKLLTVAAFLPILAGIFLQGPEYDESIMMLTVSGHTGPVWPEVPVAAGEIQAMFDDRTDLATLLADIRNTDVHPPLHYVAAWLTHLLTGPNLPAQRLVSLAALAGCLFLLLGQFRRDVGGDLPATIVFTLLFTLAPASYYAGSTARGYALVFLFLSAAYVALRRLAEDRAVVPARSSAGPAAVIGIGVGLTALTHYLAVVPAAVLGFAALALLTKQRDWRGLAVLCASAAVPVLVAGWFLLNQLDTRGGYDPVAFPGFAAMFAQLTVSLFLRVPNENLPLPEGAVSLLFAGVSVAFAVVAATILALRDRNRFMRLGLPLMVIVLHMLGIAIQQWASGAPLEKPRYAGLVWPFAAIVLAHGALWYRHRFRRGMAVPVLLIGAYILQVGLALIYTPGAPYKYVAEATKAHPGNAILMIDRGHGRGIPASVVLAAPAGTLLWIVTPEMVEASSIPTQLRSYDRLHFAISVEPGSSERISRWLDDLPQHTPYVEQDTDILRHRWFIRQPAGE
jgi:hypothetical protein